MEINIKAKLIDEEGFNRTITRLAHEILEKNKGSRNVVLIGMRTRGENIAERIKEKIKEIDKSEPLYGVLDVTLYRDDFRTRLKQPEISVTKITRSEKRRVGEERRYWRDWSSDVCSSDLIDKSEPLYGVLDVTLYRDDFRTRLKQPEISVTNITINLNDRDIILIDDVLYTGRTVRAALDALMDLGRPSTIQLCVMVDRGHREMPIRADFVGKNIPTSIDEEVQVRIKEIDGEDA